VNGIAATVRPARGSRQFTPLRRGSPGSASGRWRLDEFAARLACIGPLSRGSGMAREGDGGVGFVDSSCAHRLAHHEKSESPPESILARKRARRAWLRSELSRDVLGKSRYDNDLRHVDGQRVNDQAALTLSRPFGGSTGRTTRLRVGLGAPARMTRGVRRRPRPLTEG
jgi:hypothetical protein